MRPTIFKGLLALAVLGTALMQAPAQDKSKEDLQKEALALNTIRSEDAITKKIKDLSEDKKYARQLVQAAATLLTKKEDNTFTYSGAHILGSTAIETRDYKTAIEFLLIAIEKANKVKSEKKLANNRLLLTEAYLADHRPADAEKVAQKIMGTDLRNIEEEDDQRLLWVFQRYAENELVQAALHQGKFDVAQQRLDKLLKVAEADGYPPAFKSLVNRTKAQAYMYKGEFRDAIKVFDQLIEDTETEEGKERLREVIGNLEADAGNVDKAYEILSAQLKKKPDQAGINNDLGYILASHDRKLDEAEKMIRKAVELEPENSSFLDSMAWVLYKQKKYKEAKEFMLKAVAQERGKNTELMEHLGDIHVALGEKADAKKAYEASLGAMTFNHKDQKRKPEIEKKLKSMQ
ncbi:MAG: tetratricopeptide repeat protein [Gemmatales bacterium]